VKTSKFADIDEVLRKIRHYKGWSSFEDSITDIQQWHDGWDSFEDLHAAIRKWQSTCRPGDVFCTQARAIVACAVDPESQEDDVCPYCGHDDGLDYDNLDPVEGGNIEQRVKCPRCSEVWMDVFALSERRSLCH
jgi:hypothetical protein